MISDHYLVEYRNYPYLPSLVPTAVKVSPVLFSFIRGPETQRPIPSDKQKKILSYVIKLPNLHDNQNNSKDKDIFHSKLTVLPSLTPDGEIGSVYSSIYHCIGLHDTLYEGRRHVF
jgi:hypothetical protein